MPKPSLEKNQSGTSYPIACEDKGVHTFPKGISPKVNSIEWLEIKLAYNNVAV